MAAEQEQSQNNEEANKAVSKAEISTNPELGIKRVRTFADDLREAKKKAGVKDEAVPLKTKRGLFGSTTKPKDTMDPKLRKEKTLSEKIQPVVAPQIKPRDDIKQPSKEFIENELRRSGIIAGNVVDVLPAEKTSTPAIRTYKYDAAESVQENKVSRVSMVAAEQNRRTRNKDFTSLRTANKSSAGKNIILILFSIILVTSGIWGWIHFYTGSKVINDAALTPNKGILLFTNNERELSIDKIIDSELVVLLEEVRASIPLDDSSITKIILMENTIIGRAEIKAGKFLDNLPRVPGRLARAVSNEFLFGIHGTNSQDPVFIFKTEDYDTTFRGMLDWELSISDDLSPLFGEPVRGEFSDVVLRNKDTRILKNGVGKTVLIYGFPNTDTLLITTSEDTFFEVFGRMTASNATSN